MRWSIVCATMNGTNHQNNGISCQDQICQSPINDQFVCITMADGAGSVKKASEGASLATKEAKNILEKTGQTLFSMTEQQISDLLLGHLRQKIEDACHQLNCRRNDLASTLLFFVSNGERFIAGNIGDGMVGSIGKNDENEVILGQERGQFVNYSFFLTDNDCQQHLRITMGDYDPEKVYFLMTDGSCDCLYENSSQSFANALLIFAKWMKNYPHYSVKKALIQTMFKLFPKRTDDDCAIALITTLDERV